MIRRIAFAFLFTGVMQAMGFTQDAGFKAYIERYQSIVVSERERTGIPASIKMAQALLESDAGRSDLAQKANNHFGIKCGDDWDGKKYKKIDDEHTSIGLPKKSCFRHYQTAEESFIAHSEFLRKPRYADLFELDPTDYKAWAKGLRKAGYATSRDYPKRLIDLIEKYHLDELDQMSTSDVIVANPPAAVPEAPAPNEKPARDNRPESRPAAEPFEFGLVNDVRFIVARQDETVASLARIADVSESRVIRYNENLASPDQIVPAETRVFLQPKRNTFRGRQQWYTVGDGETILYISLLYGLDMASLCERNLLQAGQEPAPGARIKLHGSTVEQPPRLLTSTETVEETIQKEKKPAIKEADDERMDMEIEVKPPVDTTTGSQPRKNSGQLPPSGEGRTPPPIATTSAVPPSTAPGDPFGTPIDSAPKTEDTVYHTVQPGDTLWNISQRYRTTVDQIKALNQLQVDNIRSGMKLRVK